MSTVVMEQRKKIHPHKFTLWVAIASISMMFAGLTSAYIVKESQANFLNFNLPLAFWYSTAAMIASSVTIWMAQKKFKNREMASYRKLITVTFIFVLIGYVLFRADSLRSALNYYSGIILDFSFQLPSFEGKIRFLITMVLVLIMLILEVIGFHHTNPISIFSSPKLRLVRWALYAFILFLIGVFMNTNVSSFIYFQF